jgi:hypothetical protein
LFVQTATGGTWAADADGTSGTLTLTGVDPEVEAFTDRPAREVSTETPQQFVDDWPARGFDTDPPNASIALHSAAAGEVPLVVELSSPGWDASSSTLTYRAKVVGGGSGPGATLPATFGGVSLFVDNSPASTNVGLVTIDATLATDQDSIQLTLDPGMATSTPFQWATTTHYCTVESGAGTANCTGAWQVNRNVIELNGSRQVYFGTVPAPFLTTAGVTFGAVVVPAQDLTGTATLTPGATLTITGPDKQPVTITNGAFSVPVTFG